MNTVHFFVGNTTTTKPLALYVNDFNDFTYMTSVKTVLQFSTVICFKIAKHRFVVSY